MQRYIMGDNVGVECVCGWELYIGGGIDIV